MKIWIKRGWRSHFPHSECWRLSAENKRCIACVDLDMMATPAFDSNLFYRITNTALGNSYALDATIHAESSSGRVDITPTTPYSGQFWQILKANEIANGTFYLSSQLLGPRMKLDVAPKKKSVWIPRLKNITTIYDQTWSISSTGNSTYTLTPNRLKDNKLLGVNATTKRIWMEDGEDGGEETQQWIMTPVMEINNASFSASALFATATAVCIPQTQLNNALDTIHCRR